MQFSELTDQVFMALPIRKKTLQTYRSIYRYHLEVALGTHEIEEISRSEIQAVIKNLSPQTAATTLAVMKTLYREAIARELVDHSPVVNIRSSQI